MKTLPENMYLKRTLHTRLGVRTAGDILVRFLSYAECTDKDGRRVSVTRHSTTDFPNDTSIYVVELL